MVDELDGCTVVDILKLDVGYFGLKLCQFREKDLPYTLP
jgi:hypothetical protein